MRDQITFFLPTRKDSQRVVNKNTRPFSGIEGGILALKLKQLLSSNAIEQVILSTNDEKCMEIAREIEPTGNFIKIIPRPDDLCLDTTPLQELIKYVPEIAKTSHILWGHVTTPFVTGTDYDQAIALYFDKLKEGYDSLISVAPLQNFILNPDSGKIFNYMHKEGKWPRTQDLPLLYEVNHAIFLAPRSIYLKQTDRIGQKPYLYSQNKIQSFDIDWKDDFLIAEAIYDKLFKGKEHFLGF